MIDMRAACCLSQRIFLLINVFSVVLVLFSSTDTEAQNAESERRAEVYVSGFVTHSAPTDSGLSFGGDNIHGVSTASSTGGGVKVGVFPRWLGSVLGGEVEIFGHGGKIAAPRTINNGKTRFANLDLNMANLMLNVLARYPGDFIQPYVGAGLGFSFVGLDGENLSSKGQFHGSETLSGIGIQAIVGARLILTDHVFLFTEYKHFSVNASRNGCDEKGMNCVPVHEFDYQTQYVTAGAGFRF